MTFEYYKDTAFFHKDKNMKDIYFLSSFKSVPEFYHSVVTLLLFGSWDVSFSVKGGPISCNIDHLSRCLCLKIFVSHSDHQELV